MLDNGRPPGADGCALPKYGGMVEVRVCLIAKCVCLCVCLWGGGGIYD